MKMTDETRRNLMMKDYNLANIFQTLGNMWLYLGTLAYINKGTEPETWACEFKNYTSSINTLVAYLGDIKDDQEPSAIQLYVLNELQKAKTWYEERIQGNLDEPQTEEKVDETDCETYVEHD